MIIRIVKNWTEDEILNTIEINDISDFSQGSRAWEEYGAHDYRRGTHQKEISLPPKTPVPNADVPRCDEFFGLGEWGQGRKNAEKEEQGEHEQVHEDTEGRTRRT